MTDLFGDNVSDIDRQDDDEFSNDDFDGNDDSFGAVPQKFVEKQEVKEVEFGEDSFEEGFFNAERNAVLNGFVQETSFQYSPKRLKEDFDREPQLLFECFYCLGQAKKIFDRTHLTIPWHQKCLAASNNEQFSLKLPDTDESLTKVTDQAISDYFDSNYCNSKPTTQIDLEFQQASLALFGFDQAHPSREFKAKA